jgi:thiol-disulfide isomerase/thioredoxin
VLIIGRYYMSYRSTFFAALVALTSVFANAAALSKVAESTVKIDALSLTTLSGAAWRARDYRGKYVVVNFWATWCKPCIKEMPDFQTISQRKDVAVLGLAYEDSTDAELKVFLAKLKISYPNARVDVYAPMPAPLTVPKGLPTTWVFDPAGVLLKKFIGPVTQADLLAVMAPPALKK